MLKIPFPILLKHSKFCSFMKTISLKKKKHVLGTFQFFAKSLYPDLTGMAIFRLILSIFWNVENTLPILVKHSKFCSFMKTISLKKKKHVLGTFQCLAKSLYPDLNWRGNFLVDFEYFFICWRYPSNSCETFTIFFFHVKTISLKKKKHVLGTFQFGPKSLYPDITGVAIYWLILSIFWNVENTLPILLKHSKFCSFMKTISLNKKKHVLGTFQFSDQNRCIRTLPAWPFFGWFWVFFEMLKIPFQFFWKIKNFVPSWKQSVWRKKSMFWGLFNVWQNRCIRTLPAWPFFGWFWVFFYMLKINFQFLWNIHNFVLSWKQSDLEKKGMFWGLFHLEQNRCIRTLPAWPFFGWFWVFFEMLKIPFQFFWNIQNFVLSWKQSVWRKKRHVLGTLSIWTKIAVSGPYRRGHFLVDFEYFLKCWKYPSNSSETFKILFFHENNRFEEKKACFGDFSIFGKIAVSGPYRRGHLLVDFEYFLKYWKYPSNSSETFKILFFHENNRFEEKKACFGDFSIFGQNRCIRTLPAWPFFGWFWVFFEMLKIHLPILPKPPKFCSFMKTIGLKKKKHILGTLQFFDQNRCIRSLPAWRFFCWFWIFFEMLKIPFKFFWKFKIFFFHENNRFEEKKACFGDFSIFRKIAVSGPYRRGHFLVDFEYFFICWRYPSNSCETFTIFFFHENNQFGKKRHVLGTFPFGPKSLYPDITGVAIYRLILSIFWNVENTIPILLKHSKFCSFMKAISLEKKGMFWGRKKIYFGGLFKFWQIRKIAVSGRYWRGHFLVDFEYFLKCWKYISNSSEKSKILFFREDNRFEEKKACFGDFSIFCKIAVPGPYRRGDFLVDFEYFLKCWK